MGYEYYDYGSTASTGLGAVLGVLAFIWIIAIAANVFVIVCNWKVFKKAGKKGWEAIIPIYNFVVLLEITNLPMWYIALFFVPIANIVIVFLIYIELAKKFGQSAGFGVGLVFLNPIFMAILAFDKDYVYQGAMPMNDSQMYNQPVYNQQSNYNQQMYNQQPMNQPVQPQPMPQQSNCSRCGAPINPGDKFCMSCGSQL